MILDFACHELHQTSIKHALKLIYVRTDSRTNYERITNLQRTHMDSNSNHERDQPTTKHELVTRTFLLYVSDNQLQLWIHWASKELILNQVPNDATQTDNKLRSIHILRWFKTTTIDSRQQWTSYELTPSWERSHFKLTWTSIQTYNDIAPDKPETAFELITKKDQTNYKVPSHQLRTNVKQVYIRYKHTTVPEANRPKKDDEPTMEQTID